MPPANRSPAIDAALTARFAEDLAKLWPTGQPVGLAVSGGPDSTALLLLAHAAIPDAFAVASVDHGLRVESAAEAAMVAGLCAERGIAHRTITLALSGGAGVQARAREARYAALGQWLEDEGLGALVTAHHADDQAETLVMRLNRGAGLRGLAGMRARAAVPGTAQPLLRPLLGWRRGELVDICAQAGLSAVDDPSNRDPRFERARLRIAMAKADWLDRAALAASATHLAEADEVLDWAVAQAVGSLAPVGDALVWQPAGPRALQLRVLETVIARMGRSVPRGSEVARWHGRLAVGEVATLAGVRGDGRAAEWRFTPAAPHRAG
ncbi:tRNA lysidine(34) synthetase TilS [Novosphingobium cyanobacteriorum]|uniref:tRNA(Ile)-lysidine synthase n=1 Tax=Novosphingobium cyanobacteriorum TaxID=3024215 RepID=A0ABT6CGK7_9SPHN|nr:tRNA lysidine(34) synthetase TilS [Novosphingobium cyanobacteriorum]MDF8332952.1 tRNA lysidine(34) synthetase TilS [Novosphingobium cyanobacteriorum]